MTKNKANNGYLTGLDSQSELRDLAALFNAETKVIAALLVDSSAVADDIFSKLADADFHNQPYRIIFRIMKDLYSQSKPIDYIVVADVLDSEFGQEKFFQNGSVPYLLNICNQHTSVVNIDNYVQIVKNSSIVRDLTLFGDKLKVYPFNSLTFDLQLIELQRKFNSIVDSKTNKDLCEISEVVNSFENKFINWISGHNVSGVKSGYYPVDNLTGGWQPGDLIIVAARPGKGKTAFALNLTLNAALQCRADEVVVFFSLEMGVDQIIQRLVSIRSGVAFALNRSRFLDNQQREIVLNSINDLKLSHIHVSDKNDFNVIEIHNQLKKLMSINKKIKLVVVDYLQLVKPINLFQSATRQEEVSFISRTLKLIARSVDVPIVACAQLSRRIEERRGPAAVPQLSDLRESGAIEQDADIVSFLYVNADVENKLPVGDDQIDKIECIWRLEKHRNGPTGEVKFDFFRAISKFSLPKELY